jgi:hypothetical protein
VTTFEHVLIAATPIIALLTGLASVLGWGLDSKLAKFKDSLHQVFLGKDEAAARFDGLDSRLDDVVTGINSERRKHTTR